MGAASLMTGADGRGPAMPLEPKRPHMSPTSRPKSSLAAKLVAAVFAAGAIYLTLVVANLVLVEAVRMFNAGAADPDVLAAIADRKSEEDKPQIAKAKADGFLPLIYPDMLSKPGAFEEFIAEAAESRLPLIGSHVRAPTYYCNEGYGLVTYAGDRFGLRNSDALWDRAGDPGAVSLAIGDSFAHGACVADDETMPAVMTAAGLPTLNLGMGSNNPLHYAFLARLFTPAVKPEHLVLFFYANDNLEAARRADTAASIFGDMLRAGDDLRAAYLAAAPATAGADGAAAGLNPSTDYLAAMARNTEFAKARSAAGRGKWSFWGKVFKRDYWTVRHARTMLAGLLAPAAPGAAGLDPLSRLALDEVRSQCATHGCAPLAAYIPNNPKAAPDPRAPAYRAALQAYAAEAGVPFLDLTPILAPLGDAAFAVKGLHLSPEGYAAAAAAVAEALKAAG